MTDILIARKILYLLLDHGLYKILTQKQKSTTKFLTILNTV